MNQTTRTRPEPRVLAAEAGSTVFAWVIPTDEERVIARRTLALVGGASCGA